MSEEIYGTVQVLELTGRAAGGLFQGIRMSAKAASHGVDLARLKIMQLKMKLHFASTGKHNTMRLRDIEKLTGGNYALLNIPFEDEKNLIGFYDRLKKLNIPFSELPDLNIGDGYTQIAYNPQDADKIRTVVEYYKDKMNVEASEISLEQYEEIGGEKGKQLLDELAQKGYEKEVHVQLLQMIRDRNKDKNYIPISINMDTLLKEETMDAYICNVPGTYIKGQGYQKTITVKKEDCVLLDDGKTIYTHLKRGNPETDPIAKNWHKVSLEHRRASEQIRLEDTDALPNFKTGQEKEEKIDSALVKENYIIDESAIRREKNLTPVTQEERIGTDTPDLEQILLNRDQKKKMTGDTLKADPVQIVEETLTREKVKERISDQDYIPVSFDLKENLIAESPGAYFIKLPKSSDEKKQTILTLILPKKETILSKDGNVLMTNLKKNELLEVLEQNVVTGKTVNKLHIKGQEIAVKCAGLKKDQFAHNEPVREQDIIHKEEKVADTVPRKKLKKESEPEMKLDVSPYTNSKFNKEQMKEIQRGMKLGLDVSVYADPQYNEDQMTEIRWGLEKMVDVSIYANPKYDADQMAEIREGLEQRLNVSEYAKIGYNAAKMNTIRKQLESQAEGIREFDNKKREEEISLGLEKGVDVTVYDRDYFDSDQMREIRIGLEEKLDVSQYAIPSFDFFQMREIRIGLEEKLDVSQYAIPSLDSFQMEEIRTGLENGLDVSFYADSKYNWDQMVKIKEGLEAGLDVSAYANVQFNDAQMDVIQQGLKAGVDVSVYADPQFDYLQMREILRGLKDGIDVSKYAKKENDYINMNEDYWKMKKSDKTEKFSNVPKKSPVINGKEKLKTEVNKMRKR